MPHYRLKSRTTNTTITLPKKSAKKVPAKVMKKYMILQLEGCNGCRMKKNGTSSTRRSIDSLAHLAKIEMDKLDRFDIDTRQLKAACPECGSETMFNRIKWWGAGFQDNTSVSLDSKGRKNMKVSDIKDITDDFLKYREITLKTEISHAEHRLETMKKMQKSLKSTTKGK